jgi:hypothetical protein
MDEIQECELRCTVWKNEVFGVKLIWKNEIKS